LIAADGVLRSDALNGFFDRLSEALARGPAALVTVVSAQGSTPRIAGARQFLAADGSHHGTIGGGVTEARVLALARETLTDGRPRTFSADLRGRPGDVRDGICGGTMELWIVRLAPASCLPLVQAAADALRAGKCLSLSTRLDAAAPLALAAADDAFTEAIEPAPRLLIVGAGHIGRALARLADDLGFAVAVQDERPEWLDAPAFPAGCVLESSLEAAIHALGSWEGERFAALVTRGFPQDVAALTALAAIPDLAYVGLLGSRKRVATVLAAQRATGGPGIPASVLHAPVGLEIGAETPGEIAISIAAELIQIRRSSREGAVRALDIGPKAARETDGE
jgi:xanthine dehydrogenase accessory factor